MRNILIIAMLMTAACGKKGDSAAPTPPAEPAVTCSTLQGFYRDSYSPNDTLTVSGSCTFTDSVCGYSATYTVPDRITGATTITVIGTNGTPGCMSSTAHACVMEYNGHQLGVDCDSGAHQFLFTKQ